jgi:hypothetical protein
MRLPLAILELILDYKYSMEVFENKRRVLRDMEIWFLFRRMVAVYRVITHSNVNFEP